MEEEIEVDQTSLVVHPQQDLTDRREQERLRAEAIAKERKRLAEIEKQKAEAEEKRLAQLRKQQEEDARRQAQEREEYEREQARQAREREEAEARERENNERIQREAQEAREREERERLEREEREAEHTRKVNAFNNLAKIVDLESSPFYDGLENKTFDELIAGIQDDEIYRGAIRKILEMTTGEVETWQQSYQDLQTNLRTIQTFTRENNYPVFGLDAPTQLENFGLHKQYESVNYNPFTPIDPAQLKQEFIQAKEDLNSERWAELELKYKVLELQMSINATIKTYIEEETERKANESGREDSNDNPNSPQTPPSEDNSHSTDPSTTPSDSAGESNGAESGETNNGGGNQNSQPQPSTPDTNSGSSGISEEEKERRRPLFYRGDFYVNPDTDNFYENEENISLKDLIRQGRTLREKKDIAKKIAEVLYSADYSSSYNQGDIYSEGNILMNNIEFEGDEEVIVNDFFLYNNIRNIIDYKTHGNPHGNIDLSEPISPNGIKATLIKARDEYDRDAWLNAENKWLILKLQIEINREVKNFINSLHGESDNIQPIDGGNSSDGSANPSNGESSRDNNNVTPPTNETQPGGDSNNAGSDNSSHRNNEPEPLVDDTHVEHENDERYLEIVNKIKPIIEGFPNLKHKPNLKTVKKSSYDSKESNLVSQKKYFKWIYEDLYGMGDYEEFKKFSLTNAFQLRTTGSWDEDLKKNLLDNYNGRPDSYADGGWSSYYLSNLTDRLDTAYNRKDSTFLYASGDHITASEMMNLHQAYLELYCYLTDTPKSSIYQGDDEINVAFSAIEDVYFINYADHASPGNFLAINAFKNVIKPDEIRNIVASKGDGYSIDNYLIKISNLGDESLRRSAYDIIKPAVKENLVNDADFINYYVMDQHIPATDDYREEYATLAGDVINKLEEAYNEMNIDKYRAELTKWENIVNLKYPMIDRLKELYVTLGGAEHLVNTETLTNFKFVNIDSNSEEGRTSTIANAIGSYAEASAFIEEYVEDTNARARMLEQLESGKTGKESIIYDAYTQWDNNAWRNLLGEELFTPEDTYENVFNDISDGSVENLPRSVRFRKQVKAFNKVFDRLNLSRISQINASNNTADIFWASKCRELGLPFRKPISLKDRGEMLKDSFSLTDYMEMKLKDKYAYVFNNTNESDFDTDIFNKADYSDLRDPIFYTMYQNSTEHRHIFAVLNIIKSYSGVENIGSIEQDIVNEIGTLQELKAEYEAIKSSGNYPVWKVMPPAHIYDELVEGAWKYKSLEEKVELADMSSGLHVHLYATDEMVELSRSNDLNKSVFGSWLLNRYQKFRREFRMKHSILLYNNPDITVDPNNISQYQNINWVCPWANLKYNDIRHFNETGFIEYYIKTTRPNRYDRYKAKTPEELEEMSRDTIYSGNSDIINRYKQAIAPYENNVNDPRDIIRMYKELSPHMKANSGKGDALNIFFTYMHSIGYGLVKSDAVVPSSIPTIGYDIDKYGSDNYDNYLRKNRIVEGYRLLLKQLRANGDVITEIGERGPVLVAYSNNSTN